MNQDTKQKIGLVALATIILGLGSWIVLMVFAEILFSSKSAGSLFSVQIQIPFLIKFLLLTIIYALTLPVAVALAWWTWTKLAGKEPTITFRAAVRKTFLAIGENHNRRWEYLIGMTAITFIVASAHPGAPLLAEGVRQLPADVLSDSARQQINGGWDYFLYGNSVSARASVPIIVRETWFWWWAFLLYALMAFVYFLAAFFEDIERAVGAAMKVIREHIAKHKQEEQERAARAQQAAAAAATTAATQAQQAPPPTQAKKKGKGGMAVGFAPPAAPAPAPTPQPTATPTPAPAPTPTSPAAAPAAGLGGGWSWSELKAFAVKDLIIEALIAFGKELIQGYMSKRRSYV